MGSELVLSEGKLQLHFQLYVTAAIACKSLAQPCAVYSTAQSLGSSPPSSSMFVYSSVFISKDLVSGGKIPSVRGTSPDWRVHCLLQAAGSLKQ